MQRRFRIDVVVEVVVPWVVVHDAVVQRMLGSKAKHQHRYWCRMIRVMQSGGVLLDHIPR